MANVGYIRVSTTDQNTERQLDGVQLKKVFTDKVSGATTDRPELQNMLEYVREGDVIHVHSIDRLARSLVDLLALVQSLTAKGVHVRFNKENLLFTGESNPTQSLMLSIMGSVAEFERAMIRERQREGIAKAKEKGVYKGRSKTIDDEAIRSHVAAGNSYRDTAKALGVGVSTVQRAMKVG
ncbi:recombinase family protein [Pseudomonas aeruginosa]|uniref:recombinase family protein n=1 Tax=Pseudomonas aeruginosa TaxID=287 RepID=UPI00071B16EC|nr:recombinase family protein [Pseudomonas aeruginosa]KSR38312.1 resolvase [Pseudomonas aeruginosa]MBG7444460.1 recombinase family protein [Pseudomonas aeruginosa]MDU0517836.1 recombinase family protein [Pseudomonas aeruginosa]RPV10306.1 resolvase [Pseudomonas aeruginosa]HBO5074389.1 recombinase family protein [Pseudomonas aeruginosa]